MASIDKTYLKKERIYDGQLDEFFLWREDVKGEFPAIWLYKQKKEYYNEEEYNGKAVALWNTPAWFDVFLAEQCPIPFIRERLSEQYGSGKININVEKN